MDAVFDAQPLQGAQDPVGKGGKPTAHGEYAGQMAVRTSAYAVGELEKHPQRHLVEVHGMLFTLVCSHDDNGLADDTLERFEEVFICAALGHELVPRDEFHATVAGEV